MASRASHTGPATCSSPADEASLHASFARLHHALKKGDIVWARGIPAKSKVGQLSLLVKDVQLLTPCWHEIPAKLTEPVSSNTTDIPKAQNNRAKGPIACTSLILLCFPLPPL